MTNIIDNTYTALANTVELHLKEKDYITSYLGRCKSYYGYLKSTAVRLRCTTQIMGITEISWETSQDEEQNQIRLLQKTPTQSPTKNDEWTEQYRVLGEILACCTVCSTLANLPYKKLDLFGDMTYVWTENSSVNGNEKIPSMSNFISPYIIFGKKIMKKCII